MIRHDYLLRLIEQFMRALVGISELRRGGKCREAAGSVDADLQQLLGVDRHALLQLSTMELLSRIVRTGTALEARTRTCYLVALLKESGDLYAESGDRASGRASHLKALRLLLETLAQPDDYECPQFTPAVEALTSALGDEPLPAEILALLMRHYERIGEFAQAEDALFELLDLAPQSPDLLGLGQAYYRRLLDHNDSTLVRGNLPRSEVEAGLANLLERSGGGSRAAV